MQKRVIPLHLLSMTPSLLNAEFDGLLKLDIPSEGPTIFVQYRQNEFDELLATEIERLN